MAVDDAEGDTTTALRDALIALVEASAAMESVTYQDFATKYRVYAAYREAVTVARELIGRTEDADLLALLASDERDQAGLPVEEEQS
jgi:hypothetical protein